MNALQQRIFTSNTSAPFVFSLTPAAKEFLLSEGTDMKYGARHLKRAIERSLVHPLSNLVASNQLTGGDLVKIDFDLTTGRMVFLKEAEDLPAYTMAQMVDNSVVMPASTLAAAQEINVPKVARARRA